MFDFDNDSDNQSKSAIDVNDANAQETEKDGKTERNRDGDAVDGIRADAVKQENLFSTDFDGAVTASREIEGWEAPAAIPAVSSEPMPENAPTQTPEGARSDFAGEQPYPAVAEPGTDAPEVAKNGEDTPQERGGQSPEEKKRNEGIRTYAIVMTACFAISLMILLASMFVGKGGLGGNTLGGDDSPETPGQIGYVQEDGEKYPSVQQIIADNNPSVVAVSVVKPTASGVGTGMFLTGNGYIATNYHVVQDATKVTVHLYDGKQYEGNIVGYSEDDDLAVVKINGAGFPAVTFGDSNQVLVGDSVVIIGHPAGTDFGWSATTGIISAVNRNVKIKDSSGVLQKKMTLLQTSANVNSGNSGGPMFNQKGEVIGIITMKLVNGYEGMGFAIPAAGALPILNAIMEKGNADDVESAVSSHRPVLGVIGVSVEEGVWYMLTDYGIRRLTNEEAADTEGSFLAAATGAFITGLTEGSDSVGKLEPGDVIIGIGETVVSSFEELRSALYEYNGGETVKIIYNRGGSVGSATITLGTAED